MESSNVKLETDYYGTISDSCTTNNNSSVKAETFPINSEAFKIKIESNDISHVTSRNPLNNINNRTDIKSEVSIPTKFTGNKLFVNSKPILQTSSKQKLEKPYFRNKSEESINKQTNHNVSNKLLHISNQSNMNKTLNISSFNDKQKQCLTNSQIILEKVLKKKQKQALADQRQKKWELQEELGVEMVSIINYVVC